MVVVAAAPATAPSAAVVANWVEMDMAANWVTQAAVVANWVEADMAANWVAQAAVEAKVAREVRAASQEKVEEELRVGPETGPGWPRRCQRRLK
jgi:hypothetical protein